MYTIGEAMIDEPMTSSPVCKLHPIILGARIKAAIEQSDYDVGSAARLFGIGRRRLEKVVLGYTELSPKLAVKFHQIGLDGLELYLGQAAHHFCCSCQHVDGADPRFITEENER